MALSSTGMLFARHLSSSGSVVIDCDERISVVHVRSEASFR
jgi:hypothetical protein